jgi:hypothetical protein
MFLTGQKDKARELFSNIASLETVPENIKSAILKHINDVVDKK